MGKSYNLEVAMAFFQLEYAQLFWEHSLGTKVLVAWSRDTILLSFRGTATIRNALADLQVRLCLQPVERN